MSYPDHHCKKSFASQIAFITLYLSRSAFSSLFHQREATCFYFHFTVTFSIICQLEPRNRSSHPAPWCQPLVYMVKQTNALLYGYHCLFGGNLSAISIMIWIQNTNTFLSTVTFLVVCWVWSYLHNYFFRQTALGISCLCLNSYFHNCMIFTNSFIFGDRFICQMFIFKFYQINSEVWKLL